MSGQTDQPYVLFSLKACTLSSDSVSRPYNKEQYVTQSIYTPTFLLVERPYSGIYIHKAHSLFVQ